MKIQRHQTLVNKRNNKSGSFYCGKTFPTSFIWMGYLIIFCFGAIVIKHGLNFFTSLLFGIFILYIIVANFSFSYIEIIDIEKGDFKNTNKMFFIRVGKRKNIHDYSFGIVKIVKEAYASPKGATPWSSRDTKFVIPVARLWLVKFDEKDKELVFQGAQDEMNRFIAEFINVHKIPLYQGRARGFRVN